MALPLHKSAGGIVIDGDKVLLIHWDKPRDSFDFPKGTIEPGESSEHACLREVFEETGYKTKIVAFIGTNEFDFQTQTGEWRHKINDYYLLELISPDAHKATREPHETFTNAWVSIKKAAQVITRENDVAIYNKAIAMHLATTK